MPRFSVDDKMPFMEHLGELRTRIMRSLFWLLGGTLVALFRAEQITDYLSRPVTKLGYKLAFPAVFELPLVITLLARMGVVTAKQLSKNRKYAILGAFIAGAVLTPTPDAFNQTLMAGPLILLYEVGIVCARIFGRATAPVVQPSEAPGG